MALLDDALPADAAGEDARISELMDRLVGVFSEDDIAGDLALKSLAGAVGVVIFDPAGDGEVRTRGMIFAEHLEVALTASTEACV